MHHMIHVFPHSYYKDNFVFLNTQKNNKDEKLIKRTLLDVRKTINYHKIYNSSISDYYETLSDDKYLEYLHHLKCIRYIDSHPQCLENLEIRYPIQKQCHSCKHALDAIYYNINPVTPGNTTSGTNNTANVVSICEDCAKEQNSTSQLQVDYKKISNCSICYVDSAHFKYFYYDKETREYYCPSCKTRNSIQLGPYHTPMNESILDWFPLIGKGYPIYDYLLINVNPSSIYYKEYAVLDDDCLDRVNDGIEFIKASYLNFSETSFTPFSGELHHRRDFRLI